MIRAKLFILVTLMTICFTSEAFGNEVKTDQSIEGIMSLDIKPITNHKQISHQHLSENSSIVKKHITVLNKRLTKKWRSRNWNLC